MSLATVLDRLARLTKADEADVQRLLADLAAKDRLANEKFEEIGAILQRHGLDKYDRIEELEALRNKIDEDIARFEEIDAEIEELRDEESDIAAELEEAGLSYPFGLDLEMI